MVATLPLGLFGFQECWWHHRFPRKQCQSYCLPLSLHRVSLQQNYCADINVGFGLIYKDYPMSHLDLLSNQDIIRWLYFEMLSAGKQHSGGWQKKVSSRGSGKIHATS